MKNITVTETEKLQDLENAIREYECEELKEIETFVNKAIALYNKKDIKNEM